jgi:hypothetical protein
MRQKEENSEKCFQLESNIDTLNDLILRLLWTSKIGTDIEVLKNLRKVLLLDGIPENKL